MQMGEDDISREIRQKRESKEKKLREEKLVAPYKKRIAELEKQVKYLKMNQQVDDWEPIHRHFQD